MIHERGEGRPKALFFAMLRHCETTLDVVVQVEKQLYEHEDTGTDSYSLQTSRVKLDCVRIAFLHKRCYLLD